MTAAKAQTTATENYLGSVSEHLALRGVSPKRAGEHLEELAGHLSASGADPLDEFGPPEPLAKQLIEADQIGPSNQWLPVAVYAVGFLVLGVVMFLLFGGNGPAELAGRQLGSVVMMTAIGIVGVSPVGIQFRDKLFGVSESSEGMLKQILGWTLGVTIGAMAAGVAIELLIGSDQTVGLESVRSWVAGLVLGAILGPPIWWAHHRTIGRPQFPAGSPLRSSNVVRGIRLNGKANRRAELWALVDPLLPMIVLIGFIFSARWIPEPYDVIPLFAGIALGPGWLYWRSKKNSRSTDPEG